MQKNLLFAPGIVSLIFEENSFSKILSLFSPVKSTFLNLYNYGPQLLDNFEKIRTRNGFRPDSIEFTKRKYPGITPDLETEQALLPDKPHQNKYNTGNNARNTGSLKKEVPGETENCEGDASQHKNNS